MVRCLFKVNIFDQVDADHVYMFKMYLPLLEANIKDLRIFKMTKNW